MLDDARTQGPSGWSSPTSANKLGVVALYAGRIRFWADSIEQAHRFGNPAGTNDAPWELPFQQRAAQIYRDVLPETYLEGLSAVFLGCSLTMEDHPIPGALGGDWQIVLSYLTNASYAIADEMAFDLFPAWEDPAGNNEPTTPAIVRFDLLAPLVSATGARALHSAGDNVAKHLLANTSTAEMPLTQVQLDILGDLARGVRVIDIANARGFSTRSLYRELADMWETLGVSNKQQGIALAADKGWLA